MKCWECDCEMNRIQLQGWNMVVASGRFAGRGVEGIACPVCGRLELRVELPEDFRRMLMEANKQER